ncbi:RNA polymerase sigma factor [[Clostridium] dakarense]|uniref:RNA polymerase sigma factor n=1 Tax=Faecalimicrobium dakarense TaxID=1301100 RepID=UPI0004B20CCD|nr:sigma-70 family RNA polymerase sigma factor [[Clostridium] dakarense]
MEFLIKKAMKGDSEAFISLINKHEISMYKTAKAILHNEEDIGDAIQETIIAAYKSVHTLKQATYFKTWLTRILINKCNDIIRNNQNIIFIESYKEEGYSDKTHDKLEFDEAFVKLSDDYKLALNLYYVEGFNSREISEILNENENTIKSRISRGKKQLKNFLLNNKEGEMINA